jgi:putative transposase
MEKLKSYFKDTFHHLYNRGAFQQQIFIDRYDYEYFLRQLHKYKNKFAIEILCYCLMSNHFHLFVKQTTNEKTIGHFIAGLINSFTKGMNKKYKRSGVLFEGKTKNKQIVDESYFKWVVKYILNNPVDAGIVNNVYDYEYSSAKGIFELADDIITDVNELFSYFDSVKVFKEFILDDKQKPAYDI